MQKKNLFKRVATSSMAVVAALAMSSTAFAASGTQGAGVESSDTTLNFVKEIAYFNPASHNIDTPALTFNYAIAPATPAGATITDADGDVAVVKAGIASGATLTDSSAVFAGGTVAATPAGTIVSDDLAVRIDPTAFPSAGVYRYAITETDPADFLTKGFEEASDTTADTRYLDVYIVNGTNGQEVGGYVMFAGAANTSITSQDESAKTDGFSGVETSDYSSDTAIDKYKTYNVEIEKTVTGALGAKTNQFPFHATISGAPTASAVTIATEITNPTGTQVANLTLNGGAVTKTNIANLAHGGKVLISGIPVGTTVAIAETNNTPDVYDVTTTGLTTDLSGAALAASDDSDEVTGFTAGDNEISTDDVEKLDVNFTNNLDSVSPTGVLLRYGALIAVFAAAGICLVIMLGKRREQNEQ